MVACVSVSVSYFCGSFCSPNLCAAGLCRTRYACLIKVQLTSFLVRLELLRSLRVDPELPPARSFVCAQDLATHAVASVRFLILPDLLHSSV